MQDPLLKLAPNCCDVIVFDQDWISGWAFKLNFDNSKTDINSFHISFSLSCKKYINTIDSKSVLRNRLSRPLNDIYDFCKRYDVTAEIQILNWLQVHLVKQNYFESMTNYYSKTKVSSIVLLNLIKISKNLTKFLD